MHQRLGLNLMPRLLRICAPFLAGIASLTTLQCTSASTSLTAPTTQKCRIALSTGQSTFGPGGGQGSIAISTERECPWAISSEAAWISITGSKSGQGDAEVPISIAPNPVPNARAGMVAVGTEQLQLNQAAAPCTFRLSSTANSIASSGGHLSVSVTTLAGCAWSATSGVTWIAIESGAAASSSGDVTLAVANNTAAARSGSVTIAGQTYTVSQSAAASSPSPMPPSPPSPPSPAPTPPPTPKPEPVDFTGEVSRRTGACPAVTFFAAGHLVKTSADTDYKHGGCSNLSNGDDVRVRGMQQVDGSVQADRIDFQ